MGSGDKHSARRETELYPERLRKIAGGLSEGKERSGCTEDEEEPADQSDAD